MHSQIAISCYCIPRTLESLATKLSNILVHTNYEILDVTEAYSELGQTSKTELFAETANIWRPLGIFAKSSILDVWYGSEYAFAWHEVEVYIKLILVALYFLNCP